MRGRCFTIKKYQSIDDILKDCPQNECIGNNLIRAWNIINNSKYEKILCSISGGSDSDVMLDIVWKCDIGNKVDYVWFDTGLEYQATKEHLKKLEVKYGITFLRIKTQKAIPISCKEYGSPFISKLVSEFIYRLQSHNFKFEDEPYEILIKKYPKCQSALEWWCNKKQSDAFNIRKNKFLKEFMISNPPQFKIANKCCNYAKKNVSHKIIMNGKYDLNIVGVRKAEGGIRSNSYKNCFDDNESTCDNYRPIFWYKNQDKSDYEQHYDIENSDCYAVYGLNRTGCAGCPFGRNFEFELDVLQKYEPKLYKAVCNIFHDSYEYTRQYREFVIQQKN